VNFLAHLFLAQPNRDELLGNLMGDFVKGKAVKECPILVQKGIFQHRQIDKFTDSHPTFLRSRGRIQQARYRFSGILVDIFYDHFLAIHWDEFSPVGFEAQLQHWIALLDQDLPYQVPQRLHHTLQAIIHGGMLQSYRSHGGIEYALQRTAARIRYRNDLAQGIHDFHRCYEALEDDFQQFFPELIRFVGQLQ